MKLGRILIAAAVVCTVGFPGEFRVENAGGQGPRISFGVSEAKAGAGRREVRRTARRTARRTTRRVMRRHAVLPVGCPLVGLYYYCGGIHYQQVVEDGATVYIVVTP